MEVYLDTFWLINWIINCVILYSVSVLRKTKVKTSRILLAGAFGATYAAVTLFMTGLLLYIWPMSWLVMLGMVYIAFGYHSWRELMRLSGYFLVVTFTLAGIGLMCSNYLVTRQGSYNVFLQAPISFTWIFVGVACLILLGKIVWSHLKRNVLLGTMVVPVTVEINGARATVNTLLDTGNSLMDPLSKKPVMILRYDAIDAIVPPELYGIMGSDIQTDNALWDNLVDSPWASRLRVVPFSSVGQVHGLMVAFEPDGISFAHKGVVYDVQNALIAIVDRKILPEKSFGGLMHPQIFQSVI